MVRKNPDLAETSAPPMTLKRFRFLRGFETGRAIADATDLQPAAISDMENGNDLWRGARDAMCKVLNIDMRQLYKLIDTSREVRRREEAADHDEAYP